MFGKNICNDKLKNIYWKLQRDWNKSSKDTKAIDFKE